MKTAKELTQEDLAAALENEWHLGWGYACCSDIGSTSKRERLDRNVIVVANELGLTTDELFHWTNSKYGRYLADGIIGRDESVSKENVRKYLNADAVRIAQQF